MLMEFACLRKFNKGSSLFHADAINQSKKNTILVNSPNEWAKQVWKRGAMLLH